MATNRVCSVEACGKPIKSRGFCTNHYYRVRFYGDPLAEVRVPKGALVQWLEDHKGYSASECLIWPFKSRDRKGYGLLKFGDGHTGAHRAMCILAHGDAPTTAHEAAHSCGKGGEGCVNPAHLRWATVRENHQDKIAHGTISRGEHRPLSKLTEDKVRQIRSLKGKMKAREIAALFGVSLGRINRIHARQDWCWVADS